MLNELQIWMFNHNLQTDPIGHSLPEIEEKKFHRPAQSIDVTSIDRYRPQQSKFYSFFRFEYFINVYIVSHLILILFR